MIAAGIFDRRGLWAKKITERFASGAWLEPPLVTFTAGFMALGTGVALGLLLLTAHGTLDVFGRPLGTDFSSFWTAGRMALEGHAAQAYDWSAHARVQQEMHGTDLFYPWSYPPVFLLVAAAVATLPYLPALILWQVLSLSAGLAIFWRILPSRRALLLAIGFPAVLICLGHGQTGFVTAALLAGGVLALPRHEILAGVLFGLLVYKPQFGLLLPFVLLAGGYWRAVVAAAFTVVASVTVTTALWGWPVWQAFLDSIPLTRMVVFETGNTGWEKFQSAFALVRMWKGSVSLAYALQGMVTLGVLLACIWTWRSAVSLRLKGAALLIGALLSSPYMLDYDLVVFGMALALLTAHGLEHGFVRWEKTLIAFGWLAPLVSRGLAGLLHLPVGFTALAAVFMLVVMRVRQERSGIAGACQRAGAAEGGTLRGPVAAASRAS